MKMTVVFIRHTATQSNIEGRFLGARDEQLSPQGEELLERRISEGYYPPVQMVFTSSCARCLQTAQRIYSHQPSVVLQELRPYGYGRFEGKTYDEIISDNSFSGFALARHLLEAPEGGEDPYVFMTRCGQAFRQITREAEQKGVTRLGIVADLLVIQAILRRFCVPRSLYKDWGADFCGGYICEYNARTTALRILKKI